MNRSPGSGSVIVTGPASSPRFSVVRGQLSFQEQLPEPRLVGGRWAAKGGTGRSGQEQELSLSFAQVADLGSRVDIWRALAGTMGYIITQAMAHSPKRERGRKRPGGPDMWQVVYMGVAEAFVSSDVRLLEAAREVSSTFRYPRCVVSTGDFLEGIAACGAKSRCLVCGSSTHMGMHALDQGAVAAS